MRMTKKIKKLTTTMGMTLLEILLVLGIVSVLAILSMNQYQSFRLQSDIRVVQTNVDILFSALAQYYRANCSNTLPLSAYYRNQYWPMPLTTLFSQKYLIFPGNALPFSGIAKNYILQFNQIQTATAPFLPQRNYPGPNMGSIVAWRLQVAVEFNDNARASQYASLAGADCLSSQKSANVIYPCGTTTTAGNYAVWERLPAFAASQENAPTWLMRPNLLLFKQMYDTYPILWLTSGFKSNQQFYTCGGL